ncbi:radical SAM domain protein [Ferriphaselus amnicola]|uniref:Radical SAM domain protein n=1 Tax=Ferriphaselus amnicola TaxID=1188319 RepID=A0A2Z6G949_9PROT|nr:radical SAM protein [Ferriphaselus amnicola]BBE50021.1 radical SAM domain protein [Ferriphaselus amnicola]
MSEQALSTTDHDRDSAGLRYVYPVISRRAGGVSVGINLNPNNACNWRCLYCQVPNLSLGSAPPVDLPLLEQELRGFLHELLHGDFMASRVPEGMRRINDIALSGNGEPTSAAEFAEVIALVGKLKTEFGLAEQKLVLITNGSLIHRDNVQQGLRRMAECNGAVWFKLDRANEAGMLAINDTRTTLTKVRENLSTAISLCPTWIQTCWFACDGNAPAAEEEDAYLDFLFGLLSDGIRPQGVLLYGLARPSLQPEAARLSALSLAHLERFAERIRSVGVGCQVSA